MTELQVKADYELMLQPLPERVLNDAKDFRVVYDKNADPAVFSLSREGRLILIAKSFQGQNAMVNINEQFGMKKDDQVSAIGVRQDPISRLIYLVFGLVPASGASKIHVLAPIDPVNIANEKPWYSRLGPEMLLSNGDTASHVGHNFLFVGTGVVTKVCQRS